MLNILNYPNFAVESSAAINGPAPTVNNTAAASPAGISTVGAAQPNGGHVLKRD
ncbi:MAG TPA: hypothetical protein VJU82_05875 [Acidobacteriaceae bacterium]|nr:hypothetical protein [Acidobacteriaceae bacterium]